MACCVACQPATDKGARKRVQKWKQPSIKLSIHTLHIHPAYIAAAGTRIKFYSLFKYFLCHCRGRLDFEWAGCRLRMCSPACSYYAWLAKVKGCLRSISYRVFALSNIIGMEFHRSYKYRSWYKLPRLINSWLDFIERLTQYIYLPGR